MADGLGVSSRPRLGDAGAWVRGAGASSLIHFSSSCISTSCGWYIHRAIQVSKINLAASLIFMTAFGCSTPAESPTNPSPTRPTDPTPRTEEPHPVSPPSGRPPSMGLPRRPALGLPPAVMEGCELPTPGPGHYKEVWTCCNGVACAGICRTLPGERISSCTCGSPRGCSGGEVCCGSPAEHCAATCELGR